MTKRRKGVQKTHPKEPSRSLRFIALFLVFCLLTDPLTESAFSSGLVSMPGLKTLTPTDQTLFRNMAFTAPALPIARDNSQNVPFNLTSAPWQRIWLETKSAYQLPTYTLPTKEIWRHRLQTLQAASWPTARIVTQEIARPSNLIEKPKRLYLNGWVADFNQSLAAQALKQSVSHLNELSIFGVGADRNGGLAPETDFIHSALAALKGLKRRPRVLLTVANNRFKRSEDHWLLQQWLGGPEQRLQHIADLLIIAGPVDGLDIDYENLQASDGRVYEQFLEDLGRSLHARGKYLSVTVEPQTFCDGGINWARVSAQVDRVRIMAYQYHYYNTRPGAVAPPMIVQKLAERALTQIPVQKLEIALALYGFDWDTSETEGEHGHGDVVSTQEHFQRLSQQFPAWTFRDHETQAARIDYLILKGSHLVRHEVWYEDTVSINYKVQILRRLGILHIGLWQLGVGDISALYPTFTDTPKRIHWSDLTPWQFLTNLFPGVTSQYDFHLPTFLLYHQTALDAVSFLIKQ